MIFIHQHQHQQPQQQQKKSILIMSLLSILQSMTITGNSVPTSLSIMNLIMTLLLLKVQNLNVSLWARSKGVYSRSFTKTRLIQNVPWMIVTMSKNGVPLELMLMEK